MWLVEDESSEKPDIPTFCSCRSTVNPSRQHCASYRRYLTHIWPLSKAVWANTPFSVLVNCAWAGSRAWDVSSFSLYFCVCFPGKEPGLVCYWRNWLAASAMLMWWKRALVTPGSIWNASAEIYQQLPWLIASSGGGLSLPVDALKSRVPCHAQRHAKATHS